MGFACCRRMSHSWINQRVYFVKFYGTWLVKLCKAVLINELQDVPKINKTPIKQFRYNLCYKFTAPFAFSRIGLFTFFLLHAMLQLFLVGSHCIFCCSKILDLIMERKIENLACLRISNSLQHLFNLCQDMFKCL